MNKIFNDFVHFYNDTIFDIVNQWDYVPFQVRNDIVSYVRRGLQLIRDNWSHCEDRSWSDERERYDERELFLRDPNCYENTISITIADTNDGTVSYRFYTRDFHFTVNVDYEYEYGGTDISILWQYGGQRSRYLASNQRRTIKEYK